MQMQVRLSKRSQPQKCAYHLCADSVMSDSVPHGLYNLPGYSVCGIFQAGILEWVAISYSMRYSDPGIEPMSPLSPALVGGFFTTNATWQAMMIPFIYWVYLFKV